MQVHVDWTRCDGHGACAELLPELFTIDEWGFPLARGDQRDPVVPRSLEGHAQRAWRSCPLQALKLVD
jgi:ferredoxin